MERFNVPAEALKQLKAIPEQTSPLNEARVLQTGGHYRAALLMARHAVEHSMSEACRRIRPTGARIIQGRKAISGILASGRVLNKQRKRELSYFYVSLSGDSFRPELSRKDASIAISAADSWCRFFDAVPAIEVCAAS